MENKISKFDESILNIFASIDENGNYLVKNNINSCILKSYFRIRSIFSNNANEQLLISELKQWLEEFKNKSGDKLYCISLGKVTAADIQLLHPKLLKNQGVNVKSDDGFVIHLAYDDSDKLMKKWGETFKTTSLHEKSIPYLTEDKVPCYAIDLGSNFDLIVNSIKIINDEIIDSKKAEFEIDFWYYEV